MTRFGPSTTGGVLLVTATLGAGGAERQLVGMANYWAAKGKVVTLVSWCDDESAADFYDLHPRVNHVRLLLAATDGVLGGIRRSIQRVKSLRRLLVGIRPESVVSFITENNVLTLIASAGLGIQVVVSERAHPGYDTTVSSRFRWLRRWLYPRAAHVVVQTCMAEQWMRQRGCRNTVVIPNVLRAGQHSGGRRENLVLGVGRLTRQKGFDLLIEAFSMLRPRFADWRMVILGEGPERAALGLQITRLGLSDAVCMPGVDREVDAWMSRAGLVVQPSRFEGFPNVVLEAMASGAAVVCADCPAGPSELIRDGINGRLVAMEDVPALASAMQDLMAAPQLRERLGTEARKVRQQYNEDNIMPHWESLMRDHGSATST
jgi:GalNAc-alpha-(1->4)-GalNAc-alpha-(1->3)-diNAcBac-PP-undecaprenol alpha-1,4-N-acetyl-D-galactosaminyltransferase